MTAVHQSHYQRHEMTVCNANNSVMECNVILTNLKRRMLHKRLQGLCTKIVNDAVNNTVVVK